MAMLQRRFASSIYAVRRTLERMKEKREKILEDPANTGRNRSAKRLPDDFDDLPDEEQQEILAELEEAVASFDPERPARLRSPNWKSSFARPRSWKSRKRKSKSDGLSNC